MDDNRRVRAYWGINRVGEVITPPFSTIAKARAACEKMMPGGAGRLWYISNGTVPTKMLYAPSEEPIAALPTLFYCAPDLVLMPDEIDDKLRDLQVSGDVIIVALNPKLYGVYVVGHADYMVKGGKVHGHE